MIGSTGRWKRWEIPPFAEQALNLIKTRGLLNAMSEFEKMKAYSEWLEGLRAEPYLSLAFSFAGVAFRILASCPMLQPPLSLRGLRMAVPGAPDHHAPLLCKRIFRRNEELVLSHLQPRLQLKPGVGKELFPQHSPSDPKGGGGGAGARENPARERGNGSGGGQIRRGKRALSFPACKQKDNAENAAVLMWFYGGEGSVLLLLRMFVQGRL